MKKNLIYLFAAASLAFGFSSCEKEESVENNNAAEPEKTVDFIVTAEDYAENNSKLYIDSEGWSCWDEDDPVLVQYKKNSSPKTYHIKVDSTTYSIKGVTESAGQGGQAAYGAVYPASMFTYIKNAMTTSQDKFNIDIPSNQSYVANNGVQKINAPMGAFTSANDGVLRFKNIAGLLKINISTTNGVKLSSIKVEGITNGTKVVGKGIVTLTPGATSLSLSSGSNSATLSFRSSVSVTTPTSFYIVLTDFTDNVKITFSGTNADNSSFSYENTSTVPLSMHCNHIAKLNVPNSVFVRSKAADDGSWIVFE